MIRLQANHTREIIDVGNSRRQHGGGRPRDIASGTDLSARSANIAPRLQECNAVGGTYLISAGLLRSVSPTLISYYPSGVTVRNLHFVEQSNLSNKAHISNEILEYY
jgi:hypothetical protein